MAEQTYASFAVEDMKEGTGLFDDVDGTIRKFQFTKEPPDNYQAEGNPIFAVVHFELKGDGPVEERMVSQSYSLGASAGDGFGVSEDGYGLIPTADGAAVRKDSKFGTFAAALQNEGVPKTVLQAGDFSKLIGLSGHFKRVADKERNFGEDKRTRPGQKSKFPPSTLVLVKLHGMPGEAVKTTASATKATAAATTAPAAAAPSSSGNVDVDTRAQELLLAVMADAKKAGRTLQRSQITLAVSKAAMSDPNRAVYAKRAGEEAFLTLLAEIGAITYDATAKGQPVGLVE